MTYISIPQCDNNIFFMSNFQLLITLLLTTLFLWLAGCSPLPPYIHQLPLRLSSNYIYYATINFGSGGQGVQVLLDTGSQTLAVFCDLCLQGCVPQQQFITANSVSFQNVTCDNVISFAQPPRGPAIDSCLNTCQTQPASYQCQGQLNYGSGQLRSFLDFSTSYDFLAIPSASASTSFGCIFNENNFDEGIWGVSLVPSDGFLDAIYAADIAQGLSASRLFTICTNSTDTVMNIGGIDPTYHIGPGYTARINTNYDLWWNINSNDIGAFTLDGITLRDPSTSFGKYGIILDSGTDFIILPSSVVTLLKNQTDYYCESNPNICMILKPLEIFEGVYLISDSGTFFANIPPLQVVIGGSVMDTPISNYFWNMGSNNWALGVVRAEMYGFPVSILGSIWMNNFDIVFDRETPKITIYDILRCSPPARLLAQGGDDLQQGNSDDPYVLPKERESVNTYKALSKLKVKYEKSLKVMVEKN